MNAEKCELLLKEMEVLNKGKTNDDDNRYAHEFFQSSPSTEVLPDLVQITNPRAAGTIVVADDENSDNCDMSDDDDT
jgi:hypothetical protein